MPRTRKQLPKGRKRPPSSKVLADETQRDIARVHDLTSEPDAEPPLTKEEVQKWTDKPYGQVLWEAREKERAKPSGDTFQRKALELLDREVFQALLDGEIVGGRITFKSRDVPDWKRQVQIATRVEEKLLRGAKSINKAAGKVSDELGLKDDSTVKELRSDLVYELN